MEHHNTRLTLSNGLTVLLKEIHTAPLISHWIWYRVGSRDESQGFTGASHWVEHMQFKGTPQFPAGLLDRAIARDGGVWNAFTSMDWTAYFETLPADKIDLALRLEADRMVNSRFEPGEVELERTVIISERQGNENEPSFRLAEQVQTAAFEVHSYQHEVIGNLSDLQTMQREDIYRHYRTYYVPNNAVLSLAGDFDTPAMLARLQEYYEVIPRDNNPPRLANSEPLQTEERRLAIVGPGETTYLEVAYHVPQASHVDFLKQAVLASLLSGPSDLGVFGGGLSNKTSRLYRALVDKELAINVNGGLQATLDPYLYIIHMVIHPQRSIEAAKDALDEQIARLQDTPPDAGELARAVKQARALFAYNSESITNQAAWMGYAEMFANQEWFASYLDKLTEITPDDVQRAAQEYLLPQRRVVGVYHPQIEEL